MDKTVHYQRTAKQKEINKHKQTGEMSEKRLEDTLDVSTAHW